MIPGNCQRGSAAARAVRAVAVVSSGDRVCAGCSGRCQRHCATARGQRATRSAEGLSIARRDRHRAGGGGRAAAGIRYRNGHRARLTDGDRRWIESHRRRCRMLHRQGSRAAAGVMRGVAVLGFSVTVVDVGRFVTVSVFVPLLVL